METQQEEVLESPVKEFRASCGLTQAELGRRIGVNKSYICEIEKGLHPISEKLKGLLRAAHVDVEQVVEQQDALMRQKDQEIENKLDAVSARKPEGSEESEDG